MQIYVGNLPNGYRLSDLVQIFETYGCVSRATAVRDFAFIAIYDAEAARAAVAGLNGNVFGDQEIVVEAARFYPRGGRGGSFAGAGRGGGRRNNNFSQNGGQQSIGDGQEAGGYPQGSNATQGSNSYYAQQEGGYQGDSAQGKNCFVFTHTFLSLIDGRD